MAPRRSETPKQAEITFHKFGNADLSDVVFIVGTHHFHCHKMTLASRCDYFATMFEHFGYQGKEERIFNIKPITFQLFMEIFYNNEVEDDDHIFMCDSFEMWGYTNEKFRNALWINVVDLLDLAKQFQFTDVVRQSIGSAFLRYNHRCPYDRVECHYCAIKLLLAVRFDMEDYKMINDTNRKTIKEALLTMTGYYNFSAEEVVFLLERE